MDTDEKRRAYEKALTNLKDLRISLDIAQDDYADAERRISKLRDAVYEAERAVERLAYVGS